jgi:hypothetical protein
MGNCRAAVVGQVSRIVCRLENNVTDREDLLQEGLIWLVQVERTPERSEEWCLNACKLRLRQLRDSGRSVDSPKRRFLGCGICDEWTVSVLAMSKLNRNVP